MSGAQWGLKAFCIACAKFQEGDALGEVLAVAATAPYFAIYHVAVVLHARRELHMAFVFSGLLLTSALCTGIKRVLKQPRPAATCALLGNCHKHGMPSSHSAVMAFAATMALLLYLHRRRRRSSSTHRSSGSGAGAKSAAPAWRGTGAGSSSNSNAVAAGISRLAQALPLLEVLLLLLITAAVAYGRVHLGYHSPAQVAAGLALGTCLAAAWWRVTLAACQQWGAPLLRLPLLRALHFRNTLGCSDVHAAEAAAFELNDAPGTKRSD